MKKEISSLRIVFAVEMEKLSMSFWKTGSGKIRIKIPRHVKALVKIQVKNPPPAERTDPDSLRRYNELGNRARRSFHNDGPGGSYDGF